MHPLLAKTIGGLSAAYYGRQFVFGLIFPAIALVATQGKPLHVQMILALVVNTLLYPYARFVYEGVVNFILGRNVFFVNALLLLGFKFATMLVCWAGAVLIAPIGLAYLYYHHSRVSS